MLQDVWYALRIKDVIDKLNSLARKCHLISRRVLYFVLSTHLGSDSQQATPFTQETLQPALTRQTKHFLETRHLES